MNTNPLKLMIRRDNLEKGIKIILLIDREQLQAMLRATETPNGNADDRPRVRYELPSDKPDTITEIVVETCHPESKLSTEYVNDVHEHSDKILYLSLL